MQIRKVILVEDDADQLLTMKNVLVKAGYDVEVMDDGRAIVNEDFKIPDVFIVDNFMPSIHGVALCKYIRLNKNTRDVPVILISADPDIETKAARAGATLFLQKPFHRRDLLDCVATLNTAP